MNGNGKGYGGQENHVISAVHHPSALPFTGLNLHLTVLVAVVLVLLALGVLMRIEYRAQ